MVGYIVSVIIYSALTYIGVDIQSELQKAWLRFHFCVRVVYNVTNTNIFNYKKNKSNGQVKFALSGPVFLVNAMRCVQ